MTKLAHELTRALWKRAVEAGDEEGVDSGLARAHRILRANARLRQVLMHPKLGRTNRIGLVSAIRDLPGPARDLLLVLAEQRELSCLGDVLRGFRKLRAARSAELDVQVHSAGPLSRGEAERLAGALQAATGRKVRLHARVRKDLLGGLRIRVGELMVDGTLKGAFDRLEKQLVSS